MPDQARPTVISELRARIRHIEGSEGPARGVLPFGIAEMDRVLPEGGLALGGLHEFAGRSSSVIDGAAATLFAAGIAARTTGKVLWCLTRRDLFAPALMQSGLCPDRLICVEAGDEKQLLACFEEGLRHGGLSAVVAEVGRLSMVASRRLQLAAEVSGVPALAIRRFRRPADAVEFGQPTAASTRWRISSLPSVLLPVPGVGRARWLVELTRCRAGEEAVFEVEACDAKGRLAVPAVLADRPVAAGFDFRRSAV